VYTNDPKNRKITLQLLGKVKKFVTIKPSKVFLKGTVGESISQTVLIIPEKNEVFKILQVKALKGIDLKYSLKEMASDGKKGYEIVIENIRKTEGRYYDKINMITDRTDQKPISIIVSGNIEKLKDLNPEEKDIRVIPENEPEAAAQ
jgi:hypothetical protein